MRYTYILLFVVVSMIATMTFPSFGEYAPVVFDPTLRYVPDTRIPGNVLEQVTVRNADVFDGDFKIHVTMINDQNGFKPCVLTCDTETVRIKAGQSYIFNLGSFPDGTGYGVKYNIISLTYPAVITLTPTPPLVTPTPTLISPYEIVTPTPTPTPTPTVTYTQIPPRYSDPQVYENPEYRHPQYDKYSWIPTPGASCWSSTNNLGACTGRATIGLINAAGSFLDGFVRQFGL